MGFWTAWQFLTIFPAPKNLGVSQKGIGASVASFPLVGFILGAILLGMDQLFNLFLPEAGILSSTILMVSLVIFTGALHLDGLMDTFDGFAVRTTAEERLRIMADSHVGGFGVVAGIFAMLLKFAAFVSLPLALRPVALLLMPTLGRWSAAYALYAFPSAKTQGLGQAYRSDLNRFPTILATTIALAVAVGFLPFWGLAVVAFVALMTFCISKVFVARLGGLTGDTYGALIEIAEVSVLITLAIMGEGGVTSWLDLYS